MENEFQKPIYTIGYAAYPDIRNMFAVLKGLDVDAVIDIRSSPWSKTYTAYDKPSLMEACKKNGIHYRHYSREFGARQRNREYSVDGQVNFERFAQSDQFREGLERVLKSSKEGYTLCLLCAEKDPIICHRSILIGRALHESGAEVLHVTAAGLESHEHLENRLVELHFPHRDQVQMWDDPMSPEEMREEAYRRQNWKIGYRLEGF